MIYLDKFDMDKSAPGIVLEMCIVLYTDVTPAS